MLERMVLKRVLDEVERLENAREPQSKKRRRNFWKGG